MLQSMYQPDDDFYDDDNDDDDQCLSWSDDDYNDDRSKVKCCTGKVGRIQKTRKRFGWHNPTEAKTFLKNKSPWQSVLINLCTICQLHSMKTQFQNEAIKDTNNKFFLWTRTRFVVISFAIISICLSSFKLGCKLTDNTALILPLGPTQDFSSIWWQIRETHIGLKYKQNYNCT